MDHLISNPEGIVVVAGQLSSTQVFKAFRKKFGDNEQDALQLLYHCYSPSSIYSGMFLDRRKEVCETVHMKKLKADKTMETEEFRNLTEFVLEVGLTHLERSYLSLKKDIEDLHKRISAIPYTMRKNVEVWADAPDSTGTVVRQKFKVTVDFDNYEEKYKAIAISEKLYALDEKLQAMLKREASDKRMGKYRTMADSK